MAKRTSQETSDLVRYLKEARDILDRALILAMDGAIKAGTPKKSLHAARTIAKAIDFSMPIRAFVKRHGRDMSGPKKFALLVAYLTKGEMNKRIPLADVESQWNRMTSKDLLGMKFNRLYSAKARENDWVATEKQGLYHLRPDWRDIFQ